ncbi:MAG TPA: STAS domain-containing protein [bacterium]|nr:STAS domain-containing protein [bacterium]HQP99924.1 STAS domain-containing protein [bacterium]
MPRDNFSVKYYRHGADVLVRPSGPLNELTSIRLLRPILALIKKGVTSLIVDLSLVTSIDFSGLETLQEANDVIRGMDQPSLRLVVVPDSAIERELKESDLWRLFRTYSTPEQAWNAASTEIESEETAGKTIEFDEELYFTVSRDIEGDVVVYTIDGELDLEEVRQLKNVLMDDLNSGNIRVVLDMRWVRFIDSSALGLFANMGKRFQDKGGDLRFANINQQTRRVFTVFRLDRLFRDFGTLEEAIRSYRSGDPQRTNNNPAS